MQLIRYRPAPPLDRYVEWFWCSYREHPQACGEHMLPSGRAQLVFLLHEQTVTCRPGASAESLAWTGSLVHGPQCGHFTVAAKPPGAALGVSFRPGAAGAVLGAPLGELADRHVALGALWGTRAGAVREQLLAARGPQAAFHILESVLGARIQQRLLMHPAVAHALTSRLPHATSPAAVASLQRASGYSPRHFAALFRAAVGLTPKHYQRIRRFNAVVSRSRRSTPRSAQRDRRAARLRRPVAPDARIPRIRGGDARALPA